MLAIAQRRVPSAEEARWQGRTTIRPFAASSCIVVSHVVINTLHTSSSASVNSFASGPLAARADFFAFLLGATSSLPGLASFCVFAAIGIFADFILQAA